MAVLGKIVDVENSNTVPLTPCPFDTSCNPFPSNTMEEQVLFEQIYAAACKTPWIRNKTVISPVGFLWIFMHYLGVVANSVNLALQQQFHSDLTI